MRHASKITAIALSFLVVATAQAKVDVGQSAPDFSLKSAAGETVSLSDFADQWVVLEWVNYDCPFVKKFYDKSDKMAELQMKWTAQNVAWLSIGSSAPGAQGFYSPEEILKLNSKKGWSGTAYLIDSQGTVGKDYGARATPTMVVINPAGKIVYMGAIDSKSSASARDIASADNYVDLALAKGMSGEAVATPKTRAYGCGIKYN
ncbi:MAG: redoxin domain-containing protein [Verrucomicrobiota bacterium]